MNSPAVMAAVSLAGGGLGISYLFGGDPLFAAVCHLVSAGLGGYAAILSDNRRLGAHWFQPAVAACLPFLGGFAAFFLSEAVKRKKTGRLAEEFAVYLNDAASFRESVPVCDATAPDPGDLVPLADILANPVSESEQRVAVENLASMETPAAMEILRKVIDSDSGEGRFFAMTALGQMEEKLLGKLQELEEDLSSGRESGPEALVLTARTYLDFSYYELAQDARRYEYLTRAGDLLERALKDADCPDDAWILLGRVRLLQFNGAGALGCFNSFLRRNPDDQAGLLWRAEAWYLLGDFARVREDCARACRLGPIPPNIRNSAEFWLGGRSAGELAAEGEREREDLALAAAAF